MVETDSSGEGRTWNRGDQVMLLRDWLGVKRTTIGTVVNLMEKRMSEGAILLVEWNSGGRWMSVEDDLIERLPARPELHD